MVTPDCARGQCVASGQAAKVAWEVERCAGCLQLWTSSYGRLDVSDVKRAHSAVVPRMHPKSATRCENHPVGRTRVAATWVAIAKLLVILFLRAVCAIAVATPVNEQSVGPVTCWATGECANLHNSKMLVQVVSKMISGSKPLD